MKHTHYMAAAAILMLSACATAPKPEEKVVIAPVPVQTCTPVSALQKVVIPAKTKTFYAITEIENPPYEPIQRKEKQTRIITPEQVIYVDSEGREVTDVCNPEIEPSSETNG